MNPGLVLDVVALDHSYSKPWSTHPDASNARPLKTLFMEKFPRNRSLEQSLPEPDIPIDVETTQPKLPTNFDLSKARTIMSETEKQLSSLRDERSEDWEEKISRSGWTPQQNRLFNKVNKILHGDRLARLTYESNINEAVLRRNQVDKTSKRIRQALASVRWDTRLTNWLHGVLLDNLSIPLLTAYIDVLQTLRAKVPSLIDRMTAGAGHSPRAQALNGDMMNNLLKKSWDPVLNTYSQIKLQKLPGNPLILVAPSGPTNANSTQSKRMKYWMGQLSSLGKVIPVMMHTVNNGSGVSIAQCLEHMIMAVKTKVIELKTNYLNRPIVLLGWNIGALVACHVAVQETVSAVVCLGFPYTGVGGGRGDADDPLLDTRTPTLFIIGQHSNTCSIDDVEDLREKIRAENSLIVVGGADDNLRMSRAKRKVESLTQIMVDKLILDEMSQFLGGILSHGPMVQESVVVDLSDLDLRKHRRFQSDLIDGLDGDSYSTQTSSTQSPLSQQGRMTIAKALRARALAGSSGSSVVESPQGFGTVGSNTNITMPLKVKRKYTKRKNVNAVGEPSPRKRYRSTPTPPVASPVTSIQPPLSAGGTPNFAGAPELTGLLKAQSGLLPTFRILTEDGEQKLSLYSSPQSQLVSQQSLNSSHSQTGNYSNIPSQALMEDEPLIAYKLEDYNRRFGEARTEAEAMATPKPQITIEGLLRSQRYAVNEQTPSSPLTSTPISSLLSLARQMPTVHITTASSVTSQIQQLLSSLARSNNIPSTSSSSLPSGVVTPLKVPSSQNVSNQSPGLSFPTYQVSQSAGLSQVQLSQSGSPLQNSVPTLMSSLTKTSLTTGNLVKILSSTNNGTNGQKPESPSVHRVHMPEFVGPSSVCSTISSSSRFSENTKSTLGKIQVMESESVPLSTSGPEQPPLHITVNRCGMLTSNSPAVSFVLSSHAGVVTSNAKPTISTVTNVSSVTPVSEPSSPDCEIISDNFPIPVSKPILKSPEISAPTLTQGGHTYSVRAPPVETLGKVSSMLESSPITEYSPKAATASSAVAPHTISTASICNPRVHHPQPGASGTSAGGSHSHKPPTVRASPNVTVSYTATPKQSLSTLATTRTRRIRTPKQFDL